MNSPRDRDSSSSDALSDISIHEDPMAKTSSPNNATTNQTFPLASENDGFVQSVQRYFASWQEYLTNLPSSIQQDISALLSFQLPSKEFIGLLMIPAALGICAILLILLPVRIVRGSRREASSIDYEVEFIVFGDYGRRGQYGQKEMALKMEEFCSNHRCDFAVTTGDNIYNEGVQSVDDPLFKLSFEDIYLKGSLKDIKYYHVLGNHDYGGKPSAEIAYANKDDTQWVLDDYYYDRFFEGAGGIQFVFADTTPFNNNVYPQSNEEEMGPRHTEEALQKQVKFIRDKFDNTEAKWKFLVAHHPMYSAAQHGDNYDVKRRLEPVLKETDVSATITGHDHNQQHLARSNIQHFISGAGSKLRDITLPDHWNLKWSSSQHGFMHFRVSEDHVLVQAISTDDDLKVLYEYRIEAKISSDEESN